MSLADQLSGEPLPCDSRERCLNGQEEPRIVESFCFFCRFARNFPGTENHWRPVRKGEKHPDVIKAKLDAKVSRYREKAAKKARRDPAKIETLRKAADAERKTERNAIRATKNSGRSYRDGDQVLFNRVTYDTKLQSNRLNPVVYVEQIEKVRQDARRGANPFGALVLRNQNGHGYVVMAEEDFARLVKERTVAV